MVVWINCYPQKVVKRHQERNQGRESFILDSDIHLSRVSIDKLLNILLFCTLPSWHDNLQQCALLWLNLFHFLCRWLAAMEDNGKKNLADFYLLPVSLEFRKKQKNLILKTCIMNFQHNKICNNISLKQFILM